MNEATKHLRLVCTSKFFMNILNCKFHFAPIDEISLSSYDMPVKIEDLSYEKLSYVKLALTNALISKVDKLY